VGEPITNVMKELPGDTTAEVRGDLLLPPRGVPAEGHEENKARLPGGEGLKDLVRVKRRKKGTSTN